MVAEVRSLRAVPTVSRSASPSTSLKAMRQSSERRIERIDAVAGSTSGWRWAAAAIAAASSAAVRARRPSVLESNRTFSGALRSKVTTNRLDEQI